MLRLIVYRLLQLPVIVSVVFLVTFVLVWVIPGNPLENAESGKRPPPEVVEAMKRQYNLDNPWNFGTTYLKNVFTKGDFGPSLFYQDQKVSDIIGGSLPVSVQVGAAAMVVAVFLGTMAGVIGALKPGTFLDFSSMALTLVGVSLPNFVVGSLFLVVFATMLQWFPTGGWGRIDQVILPAITLGLMPSAYIARLVRLGLADVMSSDFVRTARAKGLSRNKALFKHALKVAYLPVVSYLGPATASVMTGSFVIEKVFNIPGMGEHFVNAVLNKDQFLILAVVLTYASMLVLFNLVVDIAYAWVDPRIDLS
ncbi:Oligopeptide transport system permease protein OppB [Poriferisphaera corsica]|uniref:Oligopeptide transport system permease protein OppB n=1 Tax=Poriferisphaera corsica TaxID=2528020 RepID=A0A517YZ94_9BACT|nr:ABC transporter permease [Poriferisphaera corsica]QDU35561.1 Oligopeptide transport system permease protein OppB [Poriferisphaera corsica]